MGISARLGLIVVGILVASSACTSSGSTSTPPSATLDGLHVNHRIATATVGLPQGVAIVDGARRGNPAVFAADARGSGRWVPNPKAPALTGVIAWLDGDVLRVVGHRCPGWGTETSDATSTTTDQGDPGCADADLVALQYSVGEHRWTSDSLTIDTGGHVADLIAGAGRTAFASVTRSGMRQEWERFDVESGVTSSTGGIGPAAPICPSKGELLAAGRSIPGPLSNRVSRLGSGPSLGDSSPFFSRFDGSTWVPLGAPEDPVGATVILSGGCADNGMLLVAQLEAPARTVAKVVRVSKNGTSVDASAVPDPELPGTGVRYQTDLLGRSVIASPAVSSSVPKGGIGLAILASDGTWRDYATPPVSASGIVAVTDDQVYRMWPDRDGATFRRLTASEDCAVDGC